jgi:uncharacterized membrane protein YkoI
MGKKAAKSGIAVAAMSALAIGGVGLADAASSATHITRAQRSAGGPTAEAVLTGTTLQSASAAALAAVPGGTVGRASVEDPKDPSGAAYEVHVKKADGSQVEVLEDASFKVLSVTAGHGPGGPRGPGGPGGNPNETVLTGATLTSASAAAVAAVSGATVDRATIEDKSDTSGAAYEVHLTKADGSHVVALEDSAFKVLSVTAEQHGGPGGPGGPGHRGGPPPAGSGH